MTTITAEHGAPERLGASPGADGTHFAVFSAHASRIELCLFDPAGIRERERLALPGRAGDVHFGFVPGLAEGALYGLRAHGPFDLARGHRFDPSKLLVDPYALRLDRPFVYHAALGSPPGRRLDTAPLMPRAVVCRPAGGAPVLPRRAPGFTYELLVRAYTQAHPGVPAALRGTLGALAEPAVLDHLQRLGVETVELMPLTAAIDERHLVHLGLGNAWGYNPVCQMAPDPRLVPGGWPEVRRVSDALHARGIRVLLDMVLNHSGESDHGGPTLCYRGLDNATYYAADAAEPDRLANDTGTGNTFAFWREPVMRLGIDALRAWVEYGGVDGFRYDLGTVLGRTPQGFRPDAPFLRRLAADPVLRDRLHVMEPWDVGPGGYQVGAFPAPFLEWQDRFRDDVRRFWRGEGGLLSALATRLAGSPDLFAGPGRDAASGVNFVTAHDGFTLHDLVAYEAKHNEANGENNRDGHGENHSWNNGTEGATPDPAILAARQRDMRALLATLFVARGNPMIVAGDELGRSQGGNNNAYAQDNETVWLDWAGADGALAAFTARLARLRAAVPALRAPAFLTGALVDGAPDVVWLGAGGEAMAPGEWRDDARRWLGARLAARGSAALVYLHAGREPLALRLPAPAPGRTHRLVLQTDRPEAGERPLRPGEPFTLAPRSVAVILEAAA
ncbi:glycogen debranching enzyme GlgX [Aureimonas flava]|uniref:Glycogen debranching enzyme GlgX n=1 Tax=Aureimonas flava TaxID=2320271 RepID=A0A3A1WIW1_9HYPH|nr:glycogen debranching protein GlgX [Aureimonas flava]RIX99603.1 glycogen debranching enzyme GlgX [Aureimonas flava]